MTGHRLVYCISRRALMRTLLLLGIGKGLALYFGRKDRTAIPDV